LFIFTVEPIEEAHIITFDNALSVATLPIVIESHSTKTMSISITPLYIMQYNTVQYNTIQYNTIQYNTIQYNTIQYNTSLFKMQRKITSWKGNMKLTL